MRIPNSEWRPFVVTVSKIAHRQGEQPDSQHYELSHEAVKESFAILSSFLIICCKEEYVRVNPVTMIRQKSKFIRKQQGPAKIRRLSELQWKYIINTAKELAENDPDT